MNMLKNFRLAIWTVLWTSVLSTATSLILQYVVGMNPCVMCIQQRLAMIALAIVSWAMLFFNLHNLRAKIAAALAVAAPAAFGLYIAVKQVYLQSLPITQQPSCGAPWTFRLRGAPLFDWYEPIIRGTGACGEVYKLFGIPLPVVGVLFFGGVLILLAISLYVSNLPQPKKYIAR